MEVLIESIQPDVARIVCESPSPNKSNSMQLRGIFMQADIKNGNNRIYPLSEMTRAVEEANKTIAKNGGIFGELDHPERLLIQMDRISHAIKELYVSGNNVMGRAEILKTPMGLIAEELGKSGVRYGISSRGAGHVDPETGKVSKFVFVTADLVATPSAPGAYPQPITEGLFADSRQGRKVLTLAESLAHDEGAQQYFKKSVAKFLEEVFSKM